MALKYCAHQLTDQLVSLLSGALDVNPLPFKFAVRLSIVGQLRQLLPVSRAQVGRAEWNEYPQQYPCAMLLAILP